MNSTIINWTKNSLVMFVLELKIYVLCHELGVGGGSLKLLYNAKYLIIKHFLMSQIFVLQSLFLRKIDF